jgi:uncharacterized protein YcbK (DUF882 family)
VTRRDFIKALAASMATVSMPSSGQDSPRSLWLQRNDERAMMDIASGSGYRQACWLLRDIQAGRVAAASMKLLQTAAWMQAFFAAYQVHRPFIVHSGFRTKSTNEICGGARASLHMQDSSGCFHAMDIYMDGISVDYLGRLAALARQGGVGFYSDRPRGFVHIDDGRARYWRKS